MASVYCSHSECIKSNSCQRFANKNKPDATEVKFKSICNEENGYKWHWRIRESVEAKEENSDTIDTK